MEKCVLILLGIFIITSYLLAETNSVTNVEKYKVPEKGKQLKEVEKYLKEREERLKKLAETREPESPIRRFEIEFFSSAPMIYLSTMFLLKLYQEITTQESSVLPDVQWYFIGFNSIGIAMYIAIKDYYDNKRSRNRLEIKTQNNYKLAFLNIKF